MNRLWLIVLVSLLCGILPISRASAAPTQTSPQTTLQVDGESSLVQLQFDICSHIPFTGSCPIGLSLSERYTQPLFVNLKVPQELQPQTAESTQVVVTPGPPNLVLSFHFSLGSKGYDYSVPLPTLIAPGTFTETIPMSQVLANLVDLGLPASLLGKFISLNVPVSLVSSIQADVIERGFTTSGQSLEWDSPSSVSLNTVLDGSINASSAVVSSFRSVFGLKVGLTLNLPLVPSVSLFSFERDLLDFGSSEQLQIGQWYHLAVGSPYSQVLGDGWYLSGSTATISVHDQSLTGSESNYVFIGWNGTGPGSYSGSQLSPNIIVNSPMQEIATWETLPLQTFSLSSTTIVAGTGLIIFLIAVVGVVVVFKRRSRN
jgi:hypothetical protein